MEMLLNKNLESYMKELQEVKTKIKALESEQKDIMFMISQELGSNEIIMDDTGIVLATYKTSVRTSFDTKKLEETFPHIHRQFLKKVEVKTFLIKQ